MKELLIETRVPMAARRYAALAFTPEFDAVAMRDVARVDEHDADAGTGATQRDRVLAHVAERHASSEWSEWRRRVAAPRALESVLVLASDEATRFFRLTPVSRVASALSWALWHAGVSADGIHYDAVQWRCSDSDAAGTGTGTGTGIASLRFVLTAEALPSLVVEGCVHFHEDGSDSTVQRVHLALSTGSWVLDTALGPFVASVVRPDFERMAVAAAEFSRRAEYNLFHP